MMPAPGYGQMPQPMVGGPPHGPYAPNPYAQPPPTGPPQWNAADAHPSTQTHDGEGVSPGELHFTVKAYVTRLGIAVLGGMVLGGFIMFRLFPVFIRVLEAAGNGV